jgi:hypothetical protein
MSGINMMVVTGGRERTIDDWRRLVAPNDRCIDTVHGVPGEGHDTALTIRT